MVSLMTTQYWQANALAGVIIQSIMLVYGIMVDVRPVPVCSITRHLLVTKFIGSSDNQTAVGSATIILQLKDTQYQLVIFGRFLSAKRY